MTLEIGERTTDTRISQLVLLVESGSFFTLGTHKRQSLYYCIIRGSFKGNPRMTRLKFIFILNPLFTLIRRSQNRKTVHIKP